MSAVSLLLLTLTAAQGARAARAVAVMPFENVTKDPKLDWISMGVAETISTKLTNVPDLVLVERAQLLKVMEEQKLQATGAIDSKTAVRAGRLLGADVLVVGGYQQQGDKLRLTARFVDVESAGVLKTALATGKLDDIFDLQDRIVEDLAKDLNIELKEQAISKIRERPTQSLEAYRHFGQGALLGIKKEYQAAVTELQQAAELDPKFAAAKDLFKDAFWSLNKGNYWNYASKGDSTAGKLTGVESRKAGGAELFDGQQAFTYIVDQNSDVGGTGVATRLISYYMKGDDGIYEAGGRVEATTPGLTFATVSGYSSPAMVFPYKLAVGQEWTAKYEMRTKATGAISSSKKYSVKRSFKVTSRETVEGPAGRFECFWIHHEVTQKGGGPDVRTSDDSCFAPGVGIVKLLTSYSVGTLQGTEEKYLVEYRADN